MRRLKTNLLLALLMSLGMLASAERAAAQVRQSYHGGPFSGHQHWRNSYGPYGYLTQPQGELEFQNRDFGPRVFRPYFPRLQRQQELLQRQQELRQQYLLQDAGPFLYP